MSVYPSLPINGLLGEWDFRPGQCTENKTSRDLARKSAELTMHVEDDAGRFAHASRFNLLGQFNPGGKEGPNLKMSHY